jgi:hypothetical protein
MKAQSGSRWSKPRPGRFTTGKDAVPTAQEAGWAPETVWMGADYFALTGFRYPDRPARSQSLHRLSYPRASYIYIYIYVCVCEVISKIFRTDAAKFIKLTIRPIGRHHHRSSSLPHVDTGPIVSSIFGTLPEGPFLSQCQTLSAIRPGSSQWYQTGIISASISFLEIGINHRVPNHQ